MPLPHTRTESLLLGLCLFFGMVMLHNQFAWLVLLATYYWLWQTHQNDAKPILIIAMVSLTLHHAVAFLVTHQWMDLPLKDMDHIDYHMNALMPHRRLAPDMPGYLMFQRSLEWLTYITPSWFLSAECVIAFYTGALIGFNALLKKLRVGHYPHLIALGLFALLPQGLIWQSITLKESLQLCGLVWLLFLSLRCYLGDASVKDLYLAVAAIALLAGLHEATTLIALCLVPILLLALAPMSPKAKITSALMGLITVFVLLLLPLWHGSPLMHHLRDALIAFHENSRALIGHTHFPDQLKFYPASPSWATFIWHTLQISWHYWFGPFPTEWIQDGALSWKMVLLGGYAWFRIALLLAIVSQLGRLDQQDRWIVGFGLVAYLVITGVFSLGAFNYMQSLRHHGQSDWILWALAAMVISRRLCRKNMVQY